MSWKQNVGMICQSPLNGERFEWTITDFFSYDQTLDTRIVSPEFPFDNQTCSLGVWPCVRDRNGTEWIGVFFWIKPQNRRTLNLHVKLGIQCHDGREYRSFSVNPVEDDIFKSLFLSYEQPELILKSEFMREVATLAPYGRLTIFCEIRRLYPEEAPVETGGPYVLAC